MKLTPRISLITLGVADLARARLFYEKLGWPLTDKSTDDVAFFQGHGIILGLWGRKNLAEDANMADENSSFHGMALACNYQSEEEVDKAFAHAVSIGARPAKPPHKTFWGGYSGYFADLDGHLWEIAHNPFFPMDKDGHIHLMDIPK